MCHLTRAFLIHPLGVNLNEATMMRVMSSCLFVIHELLDSEFGGSQGRTARARRLLNREVASL
jgi:hypothetical protein